MAWYHRFAEMMGGAALTGVVVGVILDVIALATGLGPGYGGYFMEVGFVLGFVMGIPAWGFYLRLRRRTTRNNGVPPPRDF